MGTFLINVSYKRVISTQFSDLHQCLLFLKIQSNKINMPERHIWVWYILLPFDISTAVECIQSYSSKDHLNRSQFNNFNLKIFPKLLVCITQLAILTLSPGICNAHFPHHHLFTPNIQFFRPLLSRFILTMLIKMATFCLPIL